MAPLEVGYKRLGWPPSKPATDDRLKKEPPPLLIISGMAYFAISIIEATLTRIALSHAATSTSIALPRGPVMPTLLTRMSSLPQASTARATIAWQEAGSLTSP